VRSASSTSPAGLGGDEPFVNEIGDSPVVYLVVDRTQRVTFLDVLVAGLDEADI
jgi:hypothetical protein